MTVALTNSRGAAQKHDSAAAAASTAEPSTREPRTRARRTAPSRTGRYSSDDEILGIDSSAEQGAEASQPRGDVDLLADAAQGGEAPDAISGTEAAAQAPEDIQAVLNANPDLRRTWAAARDSARNDAATSTPTPAQIEFLHAANAAAVQGIIDAIETQVERLLPEGVSKTARNRVVGEIYRELDSSLASNRQLARQMRDALRSGTLDAQHQRAIVALVTGRARQALPGIAKRVLNEWTSTVVAANQDRLARQRSAAHRVDIAGSGRGGDGSRRSLAPRDIDYTRMSDSDILNL